LCRNFNYVFFQCIYNIGIEDWKHVLCCNLRYFLTSHFDTSLSSLMDSTASPKVKTMEGKGVGACPLACNISGVEGHARTLGWD
jgi:hypothetical protein